jgi:RNA polymerase sigma factor (sigma-70 family)
MPRTELGPAVSKKTDWDYSGHPPITRREPTDARFKNSTCKPARKGRQTVGLAIGIERSNFEPGQSVFDDEPGFDRGRFITMVARDHINGFKGGGPRIGPRGASVSAVCEGASCGGDENAKSVAKFGATSFEFLSRRTQRLLNLIAATVPSAPLYFGTIAGAAIMKHRLFRPEKIRLADGRKMIRRVLVRHNGRLLRHILRGWFGQNYPYRWDQAASCYVDIRIDGKASNHHDLTWAQAASHLEEEASDYISTGKRSSPDRQLIHAYDAHIREYRQYQKRLPFCENPVLGFFWLWVVAALAPEDTSHHYIPSNVYREGKGKLDKEGRAKIGRRVTEKELLLSLDDVPRLDQYYRESFRQVAAKIERPKAPTERDKIIADHWPLVVKKCRAIPLAHRADAIQQCMERLVTVWNKWDESRGLFGTFAAQAIDWEIQDFLKQLRRQVPVQRSINLNEPEAVNDDDNPEPECPDVMRYDATERQSLTAKLRLVTERLHCLNWRERHVVEGRLGLNGYMDAASHEALAIKLGLSERQIRRIEGGAVAKLQRAVA